MKETSQSFSSAANVGAARKNFIVPSGTQVILYMLVSILLLIAFNLGKLWSYLNNQILAPGGGLSSVIATHAPSLHRLFHTISQSILLQVIFWVFIGCLIYILIWFFRNVGINVLNDVVADNYVHPGSYNRFSYWRSVIVRKIFFGVSLAVLIFYFFAFWRLTSSLAVRARELITNFTPIHSLLEMGGILLVIMALLHTLIIIGHITVNSWHFIYRDL